MTKTETLFDTLLMLAGTVARAFSTLQRRAAIAKASPSLTESGRT